MKIRIRELHTFLTNELPPHVLSRYKRFKILNEADFSREVTSRIARFLRRDDDPARLSVANCLYCEPSNTYPDIVIRKREKPWVIVELKEKRRLDAAMMAAEKSKMLRQHDALRTTKRGYFMYLARFGKHRQMKTKGVYGHWFYEVPITLERNGNMEVEQIIEWEKTFKKRNRYRVPNNEGK